MHIVKKIIARHNRDWSKIEDFTTTVPKLMEMDEVIVTVSFEVDGYDKQVTLSNISGAEEYTGTVEDFFLSIVGDGLGQNVETKLLSDSNQVLFGDVWDFGLDVRVGNKEVDGKDNFELLFGKDLRITKGTSLQSPAELANQLMYVLDGYIQKAEFNETGEAFLPNGEAIINLGGMGYLSVIDWRELGGFESIDLTVDNVESKLKSSHDTRVKLSLGDVDLSNKDAFLCMNGKLLLESPLEVSEEGNSFIHVNHITAIRDIGQRNSNSINVDWVEAVDPQGSSFKVDSVDAVKYLTANSFVLLLDKEVCIKQELLGRTDLIDGYTHYRAPVGLIKLIDGTLGHYIVDSYEQDIVALTTTPPTSYHNQIGNNTPEPLVKTVSNLRGNKDVVYNKAWTLDIYTL